MRTTDQKLGMGWGDTTGSTLPPLPGSPDQDESDKSLVEALKKVWEHEDSVRSFHEKQWQRSMDRKNLIFDFSRKRPWQSRRIIPGYTILCLKVAWELAKPVALTTGPLFEATTDLDPWKELLDLPTDILSDQIRSNGESPESDLITAWFKAMDSMADTGNAYMLVVPESDGMIDMRPETEGDIFGEMDEDLPPLDDDTPLPSFGLPDLGAKKEDELPTIDEMSKKSRIRFEAMNPMNVLMDSANPDRPTYSMWRQFLMPWQFEELAARHGWDNVDEILEEHKHSTKTQAEARRLDHRQNITNAPVKEPDCICVHHFIGTLPGKRGEAIFKNKYVVWSGEYVCQRAQDLGFWHGRIPIIHGGMLERAFGTYHQSIAVINLDPQEARNEMMNSLLDYMNQIVNPPTEIDHNQLHQSIGVKQLAHGMTPGGVIHAQRNGNGPVIARSQVPDMPSGMWQGLGWIDNQFTQTTGLADIGSQPRTRNRISADEAQERQSMSGGIWQKCLLNIEQKFLAPILYQAWLLGLQKTTDAEWKARIKARISRLGKGTPVPETPSPEPVPESTDTPMDPTMPLRNKLEQMLTWDAKTRWKKMAAAFRFTPKVFSSVESRRRGLEQMQFLIDGASAIPGLQAAVDWTKVGRQYILNLQLDPEEFIIAQSDQPPMMQGMPPGQMPPGAPGPVSPVAPPPPGPR